MNYDVEIENLKARVDSLQESFIQFGINNTGTVSKVDDTSNRVDAITPYTDTKTAYYGDTSVTFYDAPQGNVTVFIDGFNGGCTTEYIGDRLYVYFERPIDVAQVTVNIFIQ